MKADLYIRVSTDEQAEKGYSQRDQEERLRKYCALRQITIRNVIFEDHSAKTFNRPQWQKLLCDLKKRKRQIDAILFIKWDRFSRNAGDAYQMINILRKLGVEPQAIEQPLDLTVPENKMMLAFYLAAPEVENDRRALNTLHGMRRAKKEGRWMGQAPVGYSNKITEEGKKYIAIEPKQAAIMKWAFETLFMQKYRIEALYREALLKGLRCGRTQFWNLIRNPVYCGKIYLGGYKDEPSRHVQGKHEPIISEDLFYEVQDILDGKKKTYRTAVGSREELQLKGHLICPKCGKLLYGSASTGRSARYYYYHCNSKCGTRFKSEYVNDKFFAKLKKYTPKGGTVETYTRVISVSYNGFCKGERQDIRNLQARIDDLNMALKKARGKFMLDSISENDYKEFRQECEYEISVIEAKLFELNKTKTLNGGNLSRAVYNVLNLNTVYTEEKNIAVRRKIIGSIFPEKLVFDGIDFRTARENEVIRLMYLLDKGFSEIKNGETESNFDFSTLVPETGFEPARRVTSTTTSK